MERALKPAVIPAVIPALLLALLATAGYLRFTGLDFLLPQRTGPDSVVLEQEVELLESGDPEFQRKHKLGLYPNLLPVLASASLPEQRSLPGADAELRVHLETASRTRVWIRGWIAGLSLIGIVATYWLARFFMPASWALLAAAFSALSLLTQWYSQQGRPHGAASALLVLAIAACVHMRRHQTWTAHALAGMAMGVAAGSLQYGLAALPCYLLASTASGGNWRKALSGLMLFALACLVFYQHPGPPHVNGIEQAADQHAGLVNIAGHALNLTRMNGSGTPKTLGALLAYEPLVSIASMMAAISWLRRRPAFGQVLRSELGVVLAFVLPYLGLMLLYEVVYSRFLLPLIPMMATAAAWWLSSVVARPWLRTAWIIAILSLRATDCFALAHLRSQPDTLEQTAAWFQGNVRPDAQVRLIPSVTLPLFSSAEALRSAPERAQDPNQPWYQYQHQLLNADQLPEGGFNLRTLDIRPLVGPRAELRDLDAWFAGLDCEYVVLDVRERAGWKGMEAVRARFAAQWRLVASFAPDSNSAWSELPVEYQDHELPERPWWFWRVLQAERVGPVIEVYHRVNG